MRGVFSFYILRGIVPSTNQANHAEANIPTKEQKAKNHTRLPCSYANTGRQACCEAAPSKGPQEACCIAITRHCAGFLLYYTDMFKKQARLSRKEFSDTLKNGSRLRGTLLHLITCPSESGKVAVVVGKRIEKSAVKRHTLRRRIFSALHSAQAPQNRNIVALATSKVVEATVQELETEIATLLKQSNHNSKKAMDAVE